MNSKRTLELIRKAVEIVNAFEPKTKLDKKRKAKAIEILQVNIERAKKNEPIDSGLYGKVKELLSHSTRSTITDVRTQNKDDSFIKVDGRRRPLEIKTGGGRVEHLFNMSEKRRENYYIKYTLDYDTPEGKPRKDGTCKPSVHRYFEGVLTVKTFVEILEETKAYKVIEHEGKNDAERSIQKDSKKLYEALLETGAVEYVADFNYTADDFV